MTIATEALKTSLEATDGWASMNAYERTKLACASLLRAGESIPSWTVIRDLIGKGSSGDINRAKQDFRFEHAQALRKMEGFDAQGVPDALTPHIVRFWQAAIEYVRAEFSDKEKAWLDKVEQAQAGADHANSERDRALAEMHTLQAKIQGLESSIDALRNQVSSEQGARAQAEQMATDTRADLIGQRDRLDQALARTQEDLNKAITRLEGTERHTKMEIERVRQESAQKQAALIAQLEKEQGKYTLDTMRLERDLQEARERLKNTRETNNSLSQENIDAKERIGALEQLVQTLQTQNEKLIASISRSGRQKLVQKRLINKPRPRGHLRNSIAEKQ